VFFSLSILLIGISSDRSLGLKTRRIDVCVDIEKETALFVSSEEN
jgi:hypothetical protein